jgi:hypothetical protein
MALLKQSTTYTRTFFMVSSTDHLSAKTGLTVVVNISKAGAAFGAAAGAVSEIANGWYKVALTTADTGTLGDLSFHCTSSGADDTDFVDQVVAVDVQDAVAFGLSRLDAAISSRMATFTLPTNFSTFVIDASGRVDLSKVNGGAINNLVSGRVDSSVGALAAAVVTNAAFAANAVDSNAFAQGAADKAWGTAARTLTAATNITSTGGTTFTQTGDSFVRLGAPAGASVSADIAAVAAHLPATISKNVALNNFEFLLVSSTDHVTALTGLGSAVTAQRSIDGGAFGSCANAVSELGSGIYKINLAAADLNGSVITLRFTGTGADARLITLVTQP